MNRVTLKQICERLDVTASWVDMAVTKLHFERKGRGSRRFFTTEEYETIRKVKALRMCGIPWLTIEKLSRERDKKLNMQVHEIMVQHKNLLDSFFKSYYPSRISSFPMF